MLPAPMSRDSASRRLLDRMLAAGPPIESDDWSLAPEALELVLEQVAAGRNRIVECGSGLSTVIIARLLRERGGGTLHSLEHDPGWVETTRRRIASEGLGRFAEVIEAPLEPGATAAVGSPWYARRALERLPASGVDLLLVDGPPADPERAPARSRYPALPLLAGRLAQGATVILDDAQREGERWVLGRWEREHGVRFERRRRVAVATVG